jgi:hypothetical protein
MDSKEASLLGGARPPPACAHNVDLVVVDNSSGLMWVCKYLYIVYIVYIAYCR